MSTCYAHPRQFHGNSRFEIVRRIGAGGIGLVYEAIDHGRDARVAIKTLQSLDSRSLLRFKSEFRMLQGIHHRNLIQLGELFEENGLWFFTMELLHGVDFRSYVSEDPAGLASTAAEITQRSTATLVADMPQERAAIPAGHNRCTAHHSNTVRLRDALRQLAEGLHALHRAGMVHRDIKPHNVMVCGGRVVVLDFGLVSEERAWHRYDMDRGRIVGTPGYMAPEQAAGRSATPASDWYGVGVMIYQALAGKRPFLGRINDVISAKQHRDPPPPSQQVTDGRVVPADLEALCMRLLHRDPNARPTGPEILAQLGGTAGAVETGGPATERKLPLAGRNAELAALWAAFAQCRRGHAVPVFVQGASGMGKTTLLEYFAQQVRDQADGLVLRGRCYEIETVPYKACDGVIDDLSRYLRGLSNVPNSAPGHLEHAMTGAGHDLCAEQEAVPTATITAGQQDDSLGLAQTVSCTRTSAKRVTQSVSAAASQRPQPPQRQLFVSMAREWAALRRLFPVIDLKPESAAPKDEEIRNPIELRRQAFAALKRALALIASQRPLVILIDDLQWGDLDSVALLSELVSPPVAPGLLLVLSHRSEEAQNPVVTSLRSSLTRSLGEQRIGAIELGPLTASDCEMLAIAVSRHLERSGGLERQRLHDLARIIARESGGNPLFVGEMIQYAATASIAATDAATESGATASAAAKANASTDTTTATNSGALDADTARPVRTATQPAPAAPATIELTLEQMLAARHQQLDEYARGLVDVVAVAAQPIPQSVALRAAGIGDAGLAAVATLRAERFVRTQGAGSDDAIEMYHDRIRQSVLGQLTKQGLRGCHDRLATTLEASGSTDAEMMAGHFYRAGRFERAVVHTIRAALHAEQVLAFDRAAQMYGLLLDLQERMPGFAGDRQILYIRLGDALGNAGRGAEAADAYLAGAAIEPGSLPTAAAAAAAADVAAAAAATPVLSVPASWPQNDLAMECKRRAAEQLFRSGNIDRGRTILENVLAASRLRIYKSQIGTLSSLLLHWLQLRLRGRGLEYQVRAPEQISADERQYVEACKTAFVGLVMVDPLRGTDFATRHLLATLRQGNEEHIALSFTIDAHSSIWRGGQATQRALERSYRAIDIARRIADPLSLGLGMAAIGVVDLYGGSWRPAREQIAAAELILREQCLGVWWELATLRVYESLALYYLGDWSRLSHVAGSWMRQALERDDWYTSGVLVQHAVFGELCNDDVDRARRLMRLPRQPWKSKGYRVPYCSKLMGNIQVDLYAGDLTAAWQRIDAELPLFRRSMLGKTPFLRVRMAFLYARCALALAATEAGNESLVRIAAKEARRLERDALPWANLLAGIVRAGVAACRGDTDGASAHLQRAADQFDRAQMALFAAAARWQHGHLVGGARGEAIATAAEAAMRARGIANPAAVARLLAPGYRGTNPAG